MNDQKEKKKYVHAAFISYQSLYQIDLYAFSDVGQLVLNDDKHSFFAFGISVGSYARYQVSMQSGEAARAMNGP